MSGGVPELVHGAARRDRFEGIRKRTGRVTTRRSMGLSNRRSLGPQEESPFNKIGIVGRKTGVTLPQHAEKDMWGFDDVDAVFSVERYSDDESEEASSDEAGGSMTSGTYDAGDDSLTSAVFENSEGSSSSEGGKRLSFSTDVKASAGKSRRRSSGRGRSEENDGDEPVASPSLTQSKPAKKVKSILKSGGKKRARLPSSPSSAVESLSASPDLSGSQKRKGSRRVSHAEDAPLSDNFDAEPMALDFDDVGGGDMEPIVEEEEEGKDGVDQNESKPASEDEASFTSRRQARRKRAGGKPRRETIKIVDKAKELGIEAGLRRSSRTRMKPLAHWRGERQIYRRSDDGMGAVIPIVERSIKVPDTPVVPKVKRKTTRKKAKTKHNDDDDFNIKYPQKRRHTDYITVEDPFTQEEYQHPIARSILELPFQTLPSGDADEDPEKQLKAVYALQGRSKQEWFSGFLVLPPGARKPQEYVERTEVFYVITGEKDKLQARIYNSTVKLSKGDVFQVPQGNVYAFHNASKTATARLFFVITTKLEGEVEEKAAASQKKKGKGRGNTRKKSAPVEEEESEDTEEDDSEDEVVTKKGSSRRASTKKKKATRTKKGGRGRSKKK